MAAHGFRTWEPISTLLWLVWQPEPQIAPSIEGWLVKTALKQYKA